MTTLTIDGREIVLPPYRMGMVAQAAPAIDKVLAMAGRLANDATPEQMMSSFGFAGMADLCANLIAIVAVGAAKVDPTLTAARLADELGIADLPMLQRCLEGILAEAGLGQGAPVAPAAPAAA